MPKHEKELPATASFSGAQNTAIFIICNNHKNYTSVVLYFILSFMVSTLFYSCSLFLLPPLLCVLLSLVWEVFFVAELFEWKILIENSFLCVENMKENTLWRGLCTAFVWWFVAVKVFFIWKKNASGSIDFIKV